MKKVSLALATAGLTASLGAFAAMPTDAAPFQLVVPNLKSGMDITLEGLYLQPTNSDLDYATVASTTASGFVVTNNTNVQTVDPDYNFGFRVGLGYTFEDSGNDVQLAWTHFSHTDNDNPSFGPNDVLTTRLGVPFASDEPRLSEYLDVSSQVETKLDSVDLDVGQYIDVGTRLRMRLFAGLRFAEVSSDLSSDYNLNIASDGFAKEDNSYYVNVDYQEKFDSKFTGIGPRVGVDSVYHIGNCFGVVAHAALALLVGQTESSTSYTVGIDANIPGGDPDFDFDFLDNGVALSANVNSDDVSRVVPVLDAKLGLNYTHVFDNESQLTIEGGYQATQYIDAIDRLDASLDTSLIEEVDYDGLGSNALAIPVPATRTTSSVGFNGPYLSVNWKV
jgi:hypothetical protein